MGKIIGVRFRNAGKVVYYDPDEFDVAMGGYVVAETQRGVECGRVVMPPRELPEGKGPQASRKILRLATEEDRLILDAIWVSNPATNPDDAAAGLPGDRAGQ